MCVFVLSTVATGALVLKDQTISMHSQNTTIQLNIHGIGPMPYWNIIALGNNIKIQNIILKKISICWAVKLYVTWYVTLLYLGELEIYLLRSVFSFLTLPVLKPQYLGMSRLILWWLMSCLPTLASLSNAGAPNTLSRPAGDQNRLPKVPYVFEHKM